jgi:hypothetical protein
MRKCLWVLALCLALPAPGWTVEKEKPKGEDLPVKATLVAKKATYQLDLGGLSGDDFRKAIKDAETSGKYPAVPTVDLTLELTNISDKEVQLWTKGDPVVLSLTLKGEGAVSVAPRRAFTTIFRGPMAETLAPGKKIAIPITKLNYGFRGAAQQAYWTAPGDYTLSASFKTALLPAPTGSEKGDDGFGQVTITSEPIKIRVEVK